MLTSPVAWMNRISRRVMLLVVIAVCLHLMPFAGTTAVISPEKDLGAFS